MTIFVFHVQMTRIVRACVRPKIAVSIFSSTHQIDELDVTQHVEYELISLLFTLTKLPGCAMDMNVQSLPCFLQARWRGRG